MLEEGNVIFVVEANHKFLLTKCQKAPILKKSKCNHKRCSPMSSQVGCDLSSN